MTNPNLDKVKAEAKRLLPESPSKQRIFMDGAEYALSLPPTPAHSEAVEVLGVGFWFMHDGFKFTKIDGRTLEEIRDNMLYVANGNKHGMVCSATVTINETKPCEESVGPNVHGGKDGNYDLTEWFNKISNDPRIQTYLSTKANGK